MSIVGRSICRSMSFHVVIVCSYVVRSMCSGSGRYIYSGVRSSALRHGDAKNKHAKLKFTCLCDGLFVILKLTF